MKTFRLFGLLVPGLLVVGALGLYPAAARADVIPGLFNTGVVTPEVLLPDLAPDAHYQLVSQPDAFTHGAAKSSATGWPVSPYGPWVGDDAASKWLIPAPGDPWGDGPQGNYDWRLTFDLTGLDPSTATLSGQWSMDNAGVDILINGMPTGHAVPGEFGFVAWHPFTISSGFVSGINTLDFVVYNYPPNNNPTGVRVEFLSSSAAPVPEPATLTLAGLGALGLLGYGRRRRRTV